ncbi:MAG: sodium:solute symporter [Bacteroidota bacterium]
MNWLDIVIVIVYAVGLLSLGIYFKDQKTKKDYFLGGRSLGWFELGLSVMASQLSAISFISAAAFVGMRAGGGLQWLTYEFAVPIAMIILMVVIFPPLYRKGIVSVYEYLEERFGRSTRLLISIVFQFSRAFATGIMIYAVALVLSTVLDIPQWATILISGIVTLIYSYQGGMKAVVWGDAIQMIILFGGILICIGYGLDYLGGWNTFVAQVDQSRIQSVDFSSLGFSKGEEFGFWPMFIGGLFLYTSYYGTDQSQAQRALSARDLGQVKKMLIFNGVARFPVTLSYCIMGLIIGTFAYTNPDFLNMIPQDKPDLLMPVFIANYLPHGIIGLLITAILAAAMSSLSSAINSLSAASTQDFFSPKDGETNLRSSKYLTIFWGAVCMGLAFFAGEIADTVIEAVNKIGSLFYGPVIATFTIAILFKRIKRRAMNTGLIAGVLTNMYLWLFTSEWLFWFWWNVTGALAAFTVAWVVSAVSKEPYEKEEERLVLEPLGKEGSILIAYFVLIVCVSVFINTLL